jgi:hypothetical protein
MKRIFLLFLTIIVFCSCNKKDGKENEENINADDVGKYGCIIPENNSDPVILTSAEDNVIIIAYFDTETQLPSKVLVKQGENTFGIIFGNNDINLPIAAFSNDGYYLFGNYKDNSVSIADFDKQLNFVGKNDYQSESIAELINLGSISPEDKSIHQTKASDEEIVTYFKKQCLHKVLLAVEMASCAVNPSIGCLNAAVDNLKAITDALGYKNEYVDAVFVAKEFALCAVNVRYLCAISMVHSMASFHDDYFSSTENLSDDLWPQNYIENYIQIESYAENITDNSADIVTRVHFTECPFGYLEWAPVLSYKASADDAMPNEKISVQLTRIDSETGWSRVELNGLKDHTFYEAMVSMDVSTYRGYPKIVTRVPGNVVNFTTLEKTYAWQMAITLNIDGNTESYTADLLLDGYPDSSGGTAHLPGFKHQTMNWSNDWYNGFRLGLAYFDPSVPDWNNNESNRCITFYGRLPADIGIQTFGSIELSQDCFYGDCACGGGGSGTFAIIRVK